jgi:hypothetical protein
VSRPYRSRTCSTSAALRAFPKSKRVESSACACRPCTCTHSACYSFRADAIACRPGTTNTTACLNADQINALNNIYRESWATTPCELVEPYPRPRVVPEGKGCYG